MTFGECGVKGVASLFGAGPMTNRVWDGAWFEDALKSGPRLNVTMGRRFRRKAKILSDLEKQRRMV